MGGLHNLHVNDVQPCLQDPGADLWAILLSVLGENPPGPSQGVLIAVHNSSNRVVNII